jgi:hypothetical protein
MLTKKKNYRIFRRKSNTETSYNTAELRNNLIELVNLYQDFSENLVCFSIKIQLIRLVKKDSIQVITKILNQTLEICLKHEEIKKYIIKVYFLG